MNLLTFTYTKPNGTTSDRVLSPVSVPTDSYEGTDISELSSEDQVAFVVELSKLKEEHDNKVLMLLDKFDLNGRYRKFTPSRMTEVVRETL